MGPSVHPNPAKSKNVSVTVMAMFELESELTVGEGARKGEKRVLFIAPSLPSPSFRPSLTPLVLISFSSQPSAIVKTKIIPSTRPSVIERDFGFISDWFSEWQQCFQAHHGAR